MLLIIWIIDENLQYNLQKQLSKIQIQIERLQNVEETIEDNIYLLESELTETIPNSDSEKSEDEN